MALRGYSKKNRASRRRRRSSKRGGFGLIRHSKRKMSARYYEREHTGKSQDTRKLAVKVFIQRGSVPTNVSRKHGFFAHACFGGNYKKCGPIEFGRTPTVAAKKALVALGRSKDVR